MIEKFLKHQIVMNGSFEATIGLEIHVQLNTKTKLFCSCLRETNNLPNINICPICVGLPGVLPKPNKRAIILAVKSSLLLNMKISRESFFERKNYFYPDLPKNYQISQYRIPLAEDGYLELRNGKKIGIQRLHLEEDAGKMIHSEGGSYVDFSRSGTPLCEIVTKPDISSPDEAYEFLTRLHRVLTWCDITEGNMEEGHIRCDVNVSVRPKGSEKLGTKVEIKNVNSFRFIKEALEYEIARQIEKIRNGESIRQETRGYDPTTKKTFIMREKEFAHDYRYFPEPDLLPIIIDDYLIEEVRREIPELPDSKKKRFEEEYKLSEYSSEILTSQRILSELFEDLGSKFDDKKLVANFILEEILRSVNEGLCDLKRDYIKIRESAEKILLSQTRGELTRNLAKEAFREVIEGKADIHSAINKRKIKTEYSEIEQAVEKVLQNNPKEVQRYKGGEKKLLGFFIGEVVKIIKADPKLIREIIQRKLG